jgi:hypothetical protein
MNYFLRDAQGAFTDFRLALELKDQSGELRIIFLCQFSILDCFAGWATSPAESNGELKLENPSRSESLNPRRPDLASRGLPLSGDALRQARINV